jgi:hypothetical protein
MENANVARPIAARVANRNLVTIARAVGMSIRPVAISRYTQSEAVGFGLKRKKIDPDASTALLKRKPAVSNRVAL